MILILTNLKVDKIFLSNHKPKFKYQKNKQKNCKENKLMITIKNHKSHKIPKIINEVMLLYCNIFINSKNKYHKLMIFQHIKL